jgi:hypothetical protein
MMPSEKWRRLGERIGRMQRDEFLDRSRQALAKRSDAVLGRLHYSFAANARRRTPSAPGNFCFAPESVESILGLLRRRLPGRAEQIIQEAEQIRQHRFDLLGYVGLNYSDPTNWGLDWHWDAVHGKRAPKKAFYRLRYLDYAECGDSKVIWELNRHQHLVTLAKAYRLTNDLRYVDEILRQRRHWQANNPYPVGINWVSSLEVAFRALSWLWTYYLLQGSPGVPELRDEWLRGLALHGRHIERYLSTYFSPNTHLLGEAVGLFFLGVLCPELAASEHWKSLGWEIVLRESERQVRADGFHFEQSTYYHVYALDFFLHAAILASANDIPVPKTFEDRIEKMLDALCLLGRHGPPPRFGDDDGGRLFDPRRNRDIHLLDPLATGAVLFHRGDFKAVSGGLREETIWLLGVEGVRQWDQLEEGTVSRASACLPDSGYHLLTSDKTQLFVDVGPLGSRNGGHGHADALSICLQSRGHSLLIDPGTSEYVGPTGDRDLFRGTGLHNTLQVDGVGQADAATAFSWQRLTQSRVERWVQGKTFDLLAASHDGYQQLKQPVRHRRWVVSLKNGAYLVRDVVEGSGKHRIDIAWHLGPNLESVENRAFRVKGSEHGLAFVPAEGLDWDETLCTEIWSPAYGHKAPMTVLSFGADLVLPAEFAVLLIAQEGAHLANASFRRLDSLDSNVSSYQYVSDGDEYSFIFNGQGDVFQSDLLSSDAKYICHMRGHGASEEQLIFCGGSYARVKGGTELRSSRQIAWAELLMTQNSRVIYSSDLSTVLDQSSQELASQTTSTNSGEV